MLGRIPNEKELERGNTFLADYESAARELKYPPKPNMKKPVQAKQNAKKKNAPPRTPIRSNKRANYQTMKKSCQKMVKQQLGSLWCRLCMLLRSSGLLNNSNECFVIKG
jgi:hypothetical protein